MSGLILPAPLKYVRGLWTPPQLGFARCPCPCCPGGCVIFSDNFDRGDSSDLGDDWTEVSGDWSIASNYLTVSTSSAAVIFAHTKVIPYSIVVWLNMDASGKSERIIVDFQDIDNYYFAQLRRAATILYLGLYQRSGGVETLLGTQTSYPGSGWIKVTMCVESTRIAARAAIPPNFLDRTVAASPTSPTCGLGTGSSTGINQFNDFTVQYSGLEKPQCPSCVPCTSCIDNAGPAAFQLAVSGIINPAPPATCTQCVDLNGTFVLPFWMIAPFNVCQYIYYFPYCIRCGGRSADLYYVGFYWKNFNPGTGIVVIEVTTGVSLAICGSGSTVMGQTWSLELPGPVDCRNIADLEIPLTTAGYSCDFTNSICLLSAL